MRSLASRDYDMRFKPTPLAGAFLIHLEPRVDARGTFARAFCAQEFAAKGLETLFVQANISTNVSAGTVRGLHFQRVPHARGQTGAMRQRCDL